MTWRRQNDWGVEEGLNEGRRVAIIALEAISRTSMVKITARFFIVVGIGLGVPGPMRRGRRAQPEIIVPRASRFSGLTRLVGVTGLSSHCVYQHRLKHFTPVNRIKNFQGDLLNN